MKEREAAVIEVVAKPAKPADAASRFPLPQICPECDGRGQRMYEDLTAHVYGGPRVVRHWCIACGGTGKKMMMAREGR